MGRPDVAITVADLGARTTVVSVDGDLDLDAADEFRAALALRHGEGGRLIVDLAGTTFIDSVGLGAIAAAAKRAARADGDVTVVASDPRVVRVFESTGFDHWVRVVRSLDEAIIRGRPPTAAA